MHSLIGGLLAQLVFSAAVAGPPIEVKDIAAPPSDITSMRVRMPDPASCAKSSYTALLPFDAVMRVERGSGKALVALFAANPENWSLTLEGGIGELSTQSELQDAGPLMKGALARVVQLDPKLKSADIRITAPSKDAVGWVLVADGHEDIRLKTSFGSHSFIVGSPLTIHAEVEGSEFLNGVAHLRSPSGNTFTSAFANESPQSATALFNVDFPGDWTVRSVAQVLDANGIVRTRTTQQLFRVERPEVTLDGAVTIEQRDGEHIELSIPVSILGSGETASPRRVAVGCEIWGRTSDGEEVPVCWVARMNELTSEGGAGVLRLRFDPRWIALAEVDPASIFLRELRVQNADGFVPFVHVARPSFLLQGEISSSDEKPLYATPEMLAGHSGSTVDGFQSNPSLSNAGHVIVISHGYCTDIFPWTTEDFTGDVELYIDLNQNLSHDTFALRYEAFGRNFKSMGITGHSQAGNAAAHLYTFYWSSLDWATDGRKIQGVGVPWLGSALASDVAVLGEIFGVGCGPNFDMTYDGSALWISWIPTWVRQETWYWTTSFEDFPFWYDYCQILSDVLLSDPDDGVVEQWAGQLDGGNNRGHKEAWCHTRSMRDPPQCTDGQRNAELNSESAR